MNPPLTTRLILIPLLMAAVLSQPCAAMSGGVCACGENSLLGTCESSVCCCSKQSRNSGDYCCCSTAADSVESETTSCCQQTQGCCSKENGAECHCSCEDQSPVPVAPQPSQNSSFNWNLLLCCCFTADAIETDLPNSKRIFVVESSTHAEAAPSLQVLFCVWLT